MFDLGWSEILVIAIVLIVVVGPKDLPRVLRSFGRTTTKLRGMAGDFRRQFDDALREAELDDVKNLVDDVRKLDPRNELRKHLSPLEQAGRDIKSDLDKASKATTASVSEPVKAAAEIAPASVVEAAEPASAAEKAPAARKTATKAAAAIKPGAAKTGTAKPAAPKAAPVKAEPAKTVSAKAEPAKAVAAEKAPAKKAPAAKKDETAVKPKPVRSKKNTGSDAQ